MPTFTITVSPALVTRLQRLVTAYNQNTGLTLTVQEWVHQMLKDAAIGQELGVTAETLRVQAEANANATFEAAVKAEHDRLIATL